MTSWNGRRLVVSASMLMLLSQVPACTGTTPPLSEPGDVPVTVSGQLEEVDVCRLLTTAEASAIVHERLRRVGLAYTASRVATLGCDLGEQFGVPLIHVQLAAGPISANVFAQAYGDEAGGDPVPVRKLKPVAFLRSEQDQRSVHAFVHGSVLSLSVHLDPAKPISVAQTVELAELAVARVPRHPTLAPTPFGGACDDVGNGSLTSAIGLPPTRSSQLLLADGSLMCSWASQPGSAVVTLLRSPGPVAHVRRGLDAASYDAVRGVPAPAGVRVLSATDRAGDVVILAGRRALALVTVVPTAGFADDATVTTSGELELAAAVVEMMS